MSQANVDRWTKTSRLPIRVTLTEDGVVMAAGLRGIRMGEVLADLEVAGPFLRLVPKRASVGGMPAPLVRFFRGYLPLPPLPRGARLVDVRPGDGELAVTFQIDELDEPITPDIARRLRQLTRLPIPGLALSGRQPTSNTSHTTIHPPRARCTYPFPACGGAPAVYGLDIETDTTINGLDPTVAPVLTVALASPGFEETFTGPEHVIFSELDDRLTHLEPGVIATWNGAAFDLPFIADRAAHYDMQLGLRLQLDPDLPMHHAPAPRPPGRLPGGLVPPRPRRRLPRCTAATSAPRCASPAR